MSPLGGANVLCARVRVGGHRQGLIWNLRALGQHKTRNPSGRVVITSHNQPLFRVKHYVATL